MLQPRHFLRGTGHATWSIVVAPWIIRRGALVRRGHLPATPRVSSVLLLRRRSPEQLRKWQYSSPGAPRQCETAKGRASWRLLAGPTSSHRVNCLDSRVNFAKLSSGFLAPLLTSPFLAIAASVVLYPLLRFLRGRFRVEQETCVSVGETVVGGVPGPLVTEQVLQAVSLPVLRVGAVFVDSLARIL